MTNIYITRARYVVSPGRGSRVPKNATVPCMDNTRPPPQRWIDALDQAKADIAAGRIVDGVEIHRELKASIKRLMHGTPRAEPSTQ